MENLQPMIDTPPLNIGETNIHPKERMLALISGTSMLLYAFTTWRKNSFGRGIGLLTIGSYLLGAGLTGYSPIYKAVGFSSMPQGSIDSSSTERPPKNAVKTRVDEAAWETFPASDAPVYTSERGREREQEIAK